MKKIKINTWRKILFYGSMLLFIISFIILFRQETTNKLELIFGTFFIGLSINLFSAMLLILMLDRKKEQQEIEDNKKRIGFIIRDLEDKIRGFNVSITYMYRKIIGEAKDSDVIYKNIDKFCEQIEKIDLLKRSNTRKCTISNDRIDIKNFSHNITWKEYYEVTYKNYLAEIYNIKKNYFYVLNGELVELIDKLLQYHNGDRYIDMAYQNICIIYMMNDEIVHEEKQKNNVVDSKENIEITDLKHILIQTKNIMNYLNDYALNNKT